MVYSFGVEIMDGLTIASGEAEPAETKHLAIKDE